MKRATQSGPKQSGRKRERVEVRPLAHARGYGEESRGKITLAAALLVVATVAAYANSFQGPFVFDDTASILENPTIRQLWPITEPLSPPRGFGLTVSGRPLVNLSLAINYAISGTNVWSYHVGNLLIHVLAGLTLFGLVRRTCRQPMIRGIWREQALPVAFVTALVWLLHPLQTEAVSYVIQRAESLMALCFLLTLYAFSRATAGDAAVATRVSAAPVTGQRARGPLTAAVMACAAGMLCKEVMVVAPVVVLFYDRTFVAGTWRDAWRRRRGFYAALALTWLPLGWLVASTGGDRGGTFALTWDACQNYWLVQCEAIVRYLGLALWPSPLIFEYGLKTVARFSAMAPFVVGVAALLGVTAWAWWRRPVAGFLGVAFFLILAPTSVVPGVMQMIVEHRMYLPLAAVVTLVVAAAARWAGSRGLVVLTVVAVLAGVATWRRNLDYASDLRLWSDTVAKRPQSAAAQSSLGTAYFQRGDLSAALPHYQESLRLQPTSAQTHFNCGLTLEGLGRIDEAIVEYREAARILPYFAQAHARLGQALVKRQAYADGIEHLRIALGYLPELTEAHLAMGTAFERLGDLVQAAGSYQNALRVNPNSAVAMANLAGIAFQRGDLVAARRELERALQLSPELADAHYRLGLVAAADGRTVEARQQYAEAVRLDPQHADARLNLGVALAQAGALAEAQAQLAEAVKLQPAMAEAHANLANVLTERGDLEPAIVSYREALRLKPTYAVAHYNLANVYVQLRRWSDAKRSLDEALRLDPTMAAARELRARLAMVPD